jgi:hypothetical protein
MKFTINTPHNIRNNPESFANVTASLKNMTPQRNINIAVMPIVTGFRKVNSYLVKRLE